MSTSEPKIKIKYAHLLRPLTPSEYQALKESIRENGLLEKIKITPDGTVLDGHHRLKACQELNITPQFEVVHLNSELEEQLYVLEVNTKRRHLNTFEFIEHALQSEGLKRKIGELREKAEQHKGGRGKTLVPGEPKFDTHGEIAKLLGVSKKTYVRAKAIIEKGSEELKEKVREGKMSIVYAYKMVKRREAPQPPPLPEGEYDVIYADPPWEYYLPLRGSPDMHYPVMSTEEICRLKIPVAEDAVLFLWATNPKLEDALTVMKAWGFTYKTNMVWVKDKTGTGYYFRGQHELLLLGVKGNIGVPAEESRPPSVLYAPAGEHSEKPEAVYELIEKMYPNRRYLELFARKRRSGWTAWGDQLAEKVQEEATATVN
jgi:N6-adenosine-specific RNA methylase IME4